MFSGRSAESTTPWTNRRYGGSSPSHESMMRTRWMYSCSPFGSSQVNENGLWAGMNASTLNSVFPSAV